MVVKIGTFSRKRQEFSQLLVIFVLCRNMVGWQGGPQGDRQQGKATQAKLS